MLCLLALGGSGGVGGCGASAQPADGETLMESNLSYRRFTTQDGLPQMQTETVWQDSRGYIYIGTLSGFVRYDGRTLTPFLKGRRENIVGFQEVAPADVRALGFVRQWTVDGDKAEQRPIDPDGEQLLNNFNAADLPNGYVLLEDRQEQNRHLCRVGREAMHGVLRCPLFDLMTPDRKIYLDSTGIYVPTYRGLYVVTKSPLTPQTSKLKVQSSKTDVFSLIRCRDTLYALAADGIYTVTHRGLRLRLAYRFEAPDYGLFVRQNSSRQLIIADSHTIWQYDGKGELRQLATGFNLIKGIFIDKWDRLWVPTYQGVYCFFHCNFTNHRLSDRNDIVRAIAPSPVDGNTLVMGTLNGKALVGGRLVSNIDGNFYQPCAATIGQEVYMAGNGDVACFSTKCDMQWLNLPHDYYQAVAAYKGRLIVSTRRSLLAYSPQTHRLDTLHADLPRPWCIASDGAGRLWVAANPGLFCMENGRWRQVLETPNSQVVTTLSSDGKGLVAFARGDSVFLVSGKAQPQCVKVLEGHEIRAVHLSPRRYLIVAAIDGLFVAALGTKEDARRTTDGGQLSTLNSQFIILNSQWFDQQNGFTLIEPLKASMCETADGTVWLPGLEEMTSFRPSDLLADSQQSTIVETPRPWWQRWWVLAVGVMLLSLLVWRVTRRVERHRSQQRLRALAREKKQKELQLKAIRLKAIPHFHSNVMASIEYFVMNNSSHEASHYLKLYSDFTNQTLSDIDRPARTVNEEIDYVTAYLELEGLRYGDRLRYDVRVESNVNPQTLLPTMLLHTYCQNAVKHGIGSKSEGGCVTVLVSRQQRHGIDGTLVSVSDDGIGREAAEHSGRESSRQGLKILIEQTELYNEDNPNKIQHTVTDLVDEAGQPAGTRFETWVPEGFVFSNP